MKSNHLYSCKFCKIQIMFTFCSARCSKTLGESGVKFDGDAEKFRDLGFFLLPWIKNVKQLFLWGIFFAVSKCYLTLISCNQTPSSQGSSTYPPRSSLCQGMESPTAKMREAREDGGILHSWEHQGHVTAGRVMWFLLIPVWADTKMHHGS